MSDIDSQKSSPISGQLSLGVGLNDDATFENFLIGFENQQAVEYLQHGGSEQFVYLWGNGSPGLTHLLQAACHRATEQNSSSIYLPMKEKAEFPSQILEGANSLSLVCIDDVQELAANAEWEAALFTAFNSIKDSDAKLLIAANCPPHALQINLPDLHSRLQSGLVLQLAPLDDEEKILALKLRARNRGMELSDSVADFILSRVERSLTVLMDILDELDKSSLEQKRKLTVPLVKSTLGW